MRLNGISIAASVFLLAPGILSGQQVDPSVAAIDASVNSRVQDPDRPASPLLPGGSAAWSGQPVMSDMPSAAGSGPVQKPLSTGQSNQFHSVAASVWAPSASSSLSVASSSSASSPLNASGAQGQIQNTPRWKKNLQSHRLEMMKASDEAAARLGRFSGDEFSEEVLAVEESRPTDPNLKLRELKQAAARAARLKNANPFKSQADASSTKLWAHDETSARALGQQRHETGLLLKSGFNARSKRIRGRAVAHTPGSRD